MKSCEKSPSSTSLLFHLAATADALVRAAASALAESVLVLAPAAAALVTAADGIVAHARLRVVLDREFFCFCVILLSLALTHLEFVSGHAMIIGVVVLNRATSVRARETPRETRSQARFDDFKHKCFFY